MPTERSGPFKKYFRPEYPYGVDKQVGAEVVKSVDALSDRNLESTNLHPSHYDETPKFVPEILQGGDFRAVCRRALAVLDRSDESRRARKYSGPYYSQWGRQKMAMVVAAYHACRHTPRDRRTEGWPKDAFDLAALLKIDVSDVREAIYQSQYHRWEERYLPKQSSAVRVSQIKDALLHDVLRQNEVEDPAKVNANLYRTALQAEGAMVGTQKAVQVNVNSNVLNLPEGLTEADLKQRLERVNRLAAALKPKDAEANVIEQGENP